MDEQYPADSILSGYSDAETDVGVGVTVPDRDTYPWYVAGAKHLWRIARALIPLCGCEVFKDGDLTFGVRTGYYMNGAAPVAYAGAAAQALTDNQTNSIYLTAAGVLTVSTAGFPSPALTPHVPLATIVCADGAYDFADLVDYRGRSLLQVLDGVSAVDRQDRMPYLALTPTDDGDGTGSMAIQVKDAGGNNLAQRFLARVWIADAEFSEPDPQTDLSVLTGEQMRELEANADYEVISDAAGLIEMNIDAGGAKTVYVMAAIDGRIWSGTLVITA